jgi:U3 small nucleolar RNA-associated protein 23
LVRQCSIRHLYEAKPKDNALIDLAKTFERRRCGHHELEHPLSTLECLSEVVDPKNNMTNKHRYIVASQDLEVRAHMRKIAGVPLVYISKSIMLLEPMATLSEAQREREEILKFRQGLKAQRKPDAVQKRKREDEEGNDVSMEGPTEDARARKKKKQKGPKQPNPLSMKKSTKAKDSMSKPRPTDSRESQLSATYAPEGSLPEGEAGHRKRKRKPKPKGEGTALVDAEVAPS